MVPLCCERCEASGAIRVGGRVSLCGACIRRALDARFPIFGVPLEVLAAALQMLEPRRALGS
jgi:hypothetical protein